MSTSISTVNLSEKDNTRQVCLAFALTVVLSMIVGLLAGAIFGVDDGARAFIGMAACIFIGTSIWHFVPRADILTSTQKHGIAAIQIYEQLDPVRKAQARLPLRRLIEIEEKSSFSKEERAAVQERHDAIAFLLEQQNKEKFAAKIAGLDDDSDLAVIKQDGFVPKELVEESPKVLESGKPTSDTGPKRAAVGIISPNDLVDHIIRTFGVDGYLVNLPTNASKWNGDSVVNVQYDPRKGFLYVTTLSLQGWMEIYKITQNEWAAAHMGVAGAKGQV